MLMWQICRFITSVLLNRANMHQKHITESQSVPAVLPGNERFYLEMKDARISVVKLLVVGDDVSQGVLLEGQGCNCCQKPAVTW